MGPGSGATAGGGSGGGSVGDTAASMPLAPPVSLMRAQPLAELTNAFLLCYTAARPVVPVDAGAWLRNEVVVMLEGVLGALEDAMAAPASPLAALLVAARPTRRPAALDPAAAGGGVSDDDAAAVRRFSALLRAVPDTFAPYVCQVTLHLTGGASLASTGYDNPAATLQALETVTAAHRVGDAHLDAVWACVRARAGALSAHAVEAAGRGGIALPAPAPPGPEPVRRG
jgi:hypothetical protein